MAKKFYGNIELKPNNKIQWRDDDETNLVSLSSPDNRTSDLDLVFPSADPSADDIVSSNASGVLSFLKIADANVDAGAAIAQSKLSLSITDSEVSASAAIVESKLDLDFSSSSLDGRITANDGDISDILSYSGRSDGDSDMGTFTGSTLSDNSDIRSLLQELETAVETGSDDQTAAEVPFTPAGDIEATDVQDAIEELDSEKEPSLASGTSAQYFKGDKTLGTFATDAKSAAVADSITDAVTDVAPSQNAVFDALALKADDADVIKKDGSVAYTGNQAMGSSKFTGLAAGTANGDSVRYEQLVAVESLVNGLEWQDSVLDAVADLTAAPASEVSGDRYLLSGTGTPHANWDGASKDDIVQYDGASWVATSPTTGMFVSADDESSLLYYYGGSSWSTKSFESTTASTGLTLSSGDVQLADAAENASGIQVSSGSITLNDLGAFDTDDLDDSAATNKYTTAGDISKLAGIESGATADQSDAEIKTAYENNADTNEFSDAEQTKLAGIESGATADQDASEVPYTPAVLADWDGSADPGQTDDALDQLAERVKDNEDAIGSSSSHIELWETADGTDFTFSHALASRDLIIQIYDVATFETIEVDEVLRLTTGSIQVKSSEAPPAGDWKILVSKIS